MKKIVYVAGPMTGIKNFNFPAFFEAEQYLLNHGYKTINPARNEKPTPETWENYMRIAIPQVCKCDIICLLQGWSNSKGALFEVKVAGIIGAESRLFEDFKKRTFICPHCNQDTLKHGPCPCIDPYEYETINK